MDFSTEEYRYFLKVLKDILVTYGPCCEEGKCIKFIKSELLKIKGIVIEVDPKIGVWCIIPNIDDKKETKQSLVFDSHMDTQESFYKKPEFFFEVVNDIARLQVCATGLDNRIHCALMLVMARFLRYEHTSYCLLFSIEEEIGKFGVGRFSGKIDIVAKYPKIISKIKKIIILDVCDAVLDGDGITNDVKWPILGNGCIPFSQKPGVNTCEDVSATNGDMFNGIYKNIRKIRYGVGCLHMHKYVSLSSVSDAMDLYFQISRLEPTLLNEEFEFVEYNAKGMDPMRFAEDSHIQRKEWRKLTNKKILEAKKEVEEKLGLKL